MNCSNTFDVLFSQYYSKQKNKIKKTNLPKQSEAKLTNIKKEKKLKLCIDGDFEKNKKIISILSSINVIKSSIFQDISKNKNSPGWKVVLYVPPPKKYTLGINIFYDM